MGLFEQLSGAAIQNRGVKIQEPVEYNTTAQFLVRLDDALIRQSNRGLKTLAIFEFTILEGTALNPAGSERSWTQLPEHRPKTDPGNIKAFAAAVIGLEGDDPQVPPEVFEGLFAGKYKGVTLRLTTEKVQTQAGRDYWVHTWAPGGVDHAPAVPKVPEIPAAVLTKESWLAGAGSGTVHPENPDYEYRPDHPDWGVREIDLPF